MAIVEVEDIIELLKMGADPEIFHDWTYMCEDIVKCNRKDAFYLIKRFRKSMDCPDYVDILECAIRDGNCNYVAEIFKRCDEKDVREMLMAQQYVFPLTVFYKYTKRWDLCRDAVLKLEHDDFLKHKFIDELVYEKDFTMEKDDVLPYIHALINSLTFLPAYIVYKIVDTTFHTHKYFQEWEVISMIHLANGEDKIYTNHPEYKDAIDIDNLLVSEQIGCIWSLLDDTDQKPFMERIKRSMELFWMLKHFTILLTMEKFNDIVKSKCVEFSNSPNSINYNIEFGFWYDHLTGKADHSDKVSHFKQRYEELFGLDIEDCIYAYMIKNDYSYRK